MKYIGWIAVGGLGVGIIASSLLAVTSANGEEGFNWTRLLSSSGDCYDSKTAETNEPEHRWAWDGGDSVTIATPGTVHYRRGEGNEVIVRGESTLVGHVHVHDGLIEMSCHGLFNGGDVNITLPGRDFHEVSLEGSPRLVMENLDQSELELNIGGSGSAHVSGSVEKVRTSISGSGKVIFADLAMKELKIHVSGSGQMEGKGSSDTTDVAISGSGRVDLTDVPMKEVAITISGSGGVEAAPRDKADVNISGSGNVTLLTHPESVNTHISGSGRVVQLPSKTTKEG